MSTPGSVIGLARKQGGKMVDVKLVDTMKDEGSGSASSSLASMQRVPDFLPNGDVFTRDSVEMWVSQKCKEHDALPLRTDPYEFCL